MQQITRTPDPDGSVNFKFDCDLDRPQLGLGFDTQAPLPQSGRVTMCGDGLHVFLVPMPLDAALISVTCPCGDKRFEGKLKIDGEHGVMEMFVPDEIS